MNADRRAVWERYVLAWKASTREDKLAVLSNCVSPNCVYTDPLVRADGLEQLVSYMLNFHGQIPNGYFVTDEFLAHGAQSIARWTMRGEEGNALGRGMSHGVYGDDGLLASMTGFFETAPVEQ